jgi:glutathione synthase/RimK-type ligase-like ATP-grasp enzyme
MKKTLIIVDKIGEKKKYLAEYLSMRLKGISEVDLKTIEEISIYASPKELRVMIGDFDISEYDLVFFRRVGDRYISLAAIIARYLHQKGVKVVDETLLDIGLWEDKLTVAVRLSMAHLPTIPTFYLSTGQVYAYKLIVDRVGLPFIAKDMNKQRMEGIFSISSEKDFENLIASNRDSKFIFQKLIDRKNELRIFVTGDIVGTVLQKDLRNFSDLKVVMQEELPEVFYKASEINDEITTVALSAAKLLRIQIAGVDVMVDTDDKVWIVEVNRGPGITADKDKSPELSVTADYFQKVLKE